MKISIVTPSYNQAGFLERTILSVWNQKGDFDLEHIIIDGGSTDQSMGIIKKYDHLYRSGQFPLNCKTFKFTWLSERDKGQSDALNKGFALATGDIFGWLNSDDVFCSNASLLIVCQAFTKYDYDIVVGNASMIDENDQMIRDLPVMINRIDNITFQKELAAIQKSNIIIQPSCLFKRHIWESLGIDEYYYIMDWALWINAFKSNYSFLKIDHCIGSNRIQTSSKTVFASFDKTEAIKRTTEINSLYKKNNLWCLNRFYFLLFLFLLKISAFAPLGTLIDSMIAKGKTLRNLLIYKYKLY
ncbi:MAG: glycosyltransferase family 2 protein [Pseudomonadota bacterium]